MGSTQMGGRWRRCARAPSSHQQRHRSNLRSVCAANSSLAFRARRRLVGATRPKTPSGSCDYSECPKVLEIFWSDASRAVLFCFGLSGGAETISV